MPIVIGMEQRLSLCSFFCTHFGDKNWDMTEMEKGVISGECLVETKNTHERQGDNLDDRQQHRLAVIF